VRLHCLLETAIKALKIPELHTSLFDWFNSSFVYSFICKPLDHHSLIFCTIFANSTCSRLTAYPQNSTPITYSLTHSLMRWFTHCRTRFSLCSDSGETTLGWLETHINFKQPQLVQWLHTKMRPSEVGDVATTSGPWSTSGPLPVGVASRIRAANLHGAFLSHDRSTDLSDPRGRSKFKVFRFSQLRNLVTVM